MGWTHAGDRVPRTSWLLLVAVAWLLLLPPGPAWASGLTPTTTVQDGCERARQLVADERHDDAVTLITGLREAAPDDAAPACTTEYLDALIGLTTPQEPTLANRVEDTWTSFLDDHVTPWLVPALALLAWSALVLAAARLLLLTPRLVGNDWARLVSTRGWFAPVLLVVAWAALLVSGLLATGLLHVVVIAPGEWTNRWGTLALMTFVLLVLSATWWRGSRNEGSSAVVASVLTVAAAGVVPASTLLVLMIANDPVPVPALGPATLVGLGAAAAFAAAWGGGTRLTIRLDGAVEGSGISAEQIRLVAGRLGSAPPRGLEVPLGTDASFLAPVSLDSLPANAVLAAVDRLWKLSRPPTPWLLVVTVASADLLSMVLTRNGERIKTDTVHRGTLLRPLREVMSDDERAAVDLATFPAAFAVVTMGRERQDPGLAGAVSWQSVGMQFLGALCADDDRDTQRTVFARAVEIDPGNLLARTSYWHALYRDAVDAPTLQRYRSLLDDLLGPWDEEGAPARSAAVAPGRLDRKEAALRLRLLFSRVAVGINLRCLDAHDTDGLAERARELLDEADRPVDHSGPQPVQWSEMRRTARYLVMSLAAFELHPRPGSVAGHPHPENLGPAANYALGCYYASVVTEAERKDGSLHDTEVTAAVRHLELASVAPALRAWRRHDPQLSGLRGHPTYRATFPTSRQPA
ncbi:hypothetical protein [Jannaschia sp. R86511]|uniref:hypothetical protein n=1 Tax=Jannaschia sp. R86511 TaxID=3093853 RepID=UPI0036D3A65C